jgi:hypothetical protein
VGQLARRSYLAASRVSTGVTHPSTAIAGLSSLLGDIGVIAAAAFPAVRAE